MVIFRLYCFCSILYLGIVHNIILSSGNLSESALAIQLAVRPEINRNNAISVHCYYHRHRCDHDHHDHDTRITIIIYTCVCVCVCACASKVVYNTSRSP